MADEPTQQPDIPEPEETLVGPGGLSEPRRSLGRATAIMASGTLVSRLLGFAKTALVGAALYTTSLSVNAYDVANRIPNALYAVLAAGVLNSVLVPQIVKAMRRPDGKRTVDRMITIVLAISLGITAIFTVAAPLVLQFYPTGWSQGQRDLAIGFALLVMPQLFFYAAYTVFGEVLNAREQFGPYMWAPVLNNLIAIGGLIAYLSIYGTYSAENGAPESWTPARIAWFAIPATIGMAAQAAILLWPLIRGGFVPKFVWRGPKGELASMRTVASWALGAVLVEQAAVLLSINVAAEANPDNADPSIAGNNAYGVALMIYLLPHSLITVSIVTALGTTIAKHYTGGDVPAVRSDVVGGLRIIGVFTTIATAVLVVLAPWLARLVQPTVPIDQVRSLGWVVVAFAVGLVPLGAMILVKRVYFVLEDARGIFFIHIPMALTIIAVSYASRALLDNYWWTFGVALGLSLSNVVGLTLRYNGLRTRLGGLGSRGVAKVHLLAAFGALVAALVGFALRWWVLPDLETASGSLSQVYLVGGFVCVVVGLAMLLVYGVMLKLTRVREVDDLVGTVTRRIRRK